MERRKLTKKQVQKLVSEKIHEGLATLDLPEQSKKISKLIDKSARAIGAEFLSIQKKEHKLQKKIQKSLDKAKKILEGKTKKLTKKVKTAVKKKVKRGVKKVKASVDNSKKVS